MAERSASGTATEEVLRALGVRITSVGPQIRGHCPVHRFVTGHEDSNPSWGINALTGAWLCFSCHETGSLPMLVEALGGDVDNLSDLILTNVHEQFVAAQQEDEPPPELPQHVSAYAFNKNPYPPAKVMASRDIDAQTCVAFNIRWDAEGKCWLLPIYACEGALLGWQEKSTGYFNNVPKGVMKRDSLFGYQLLTGTAPIIVVESPLDAARFFHHGYEAVAIYGSFISDEQVAALSTVDIRHRPRVVLAFDNDESGHKAAHWSTRRFLDLGVDVRYFHYGTKLPVDPGEISARDLHRGVRLATSTMPLETWSVVDKPPGQKKRTARR